MITQAQSKERCLSSECDDLSLGWRNFLDHDSNLSNSVNVAVCFSVISINKQHAINGERFATLWVYTIEGEKPTRTAVQTVADSNVTIIFHF